jgi:hypothetical protein
VYPAGPELLEAAGLAAGPQIKVTERDLAEKIQPQVERLRRGLFRTAAASFTSMSEAALWIERHATSGGLTRLPGRAQKQAEDLIVGAQVKLHAYSTLVGHEAVVHEIVRRLPYTKPGEQGLLYAPVRFTPRTTKLGRLERATRVLAEATGFPQESVVAYVLSGEAPTLPGVRVSTTYRRLGEPGMPLQSVVTEMFSRDVTAAPSQRPSGELKDPLRGHARGAERPAAVDLDALADARQYGVNARRRHARLLHDAVDAQPGIHQDG